MFQTQRRAAFFSFLFTVILLFAGQAEAVGPVPGEAAPPIVAAKWSRGIPIEQYEAGQVYVVDLWSTWCKPCIASMPELRELENQFSESVTVIAMNIWEMEPQQMPQFLEANGSIMPAHVALDSVPSGREANEGLTAVQFLGTSERVSIPKSFIVDQSGRIAWIGLPGGLEEPLSRVVAGTWDTKAFAEKYLEELAAADKSRK